MTLPPDPFLAAGAGAAASATEPVGRLRVGLVIPSLSGGGAEFVAVQWAHYLQDLGHEVGVITTHDDTTSRELTVIRLTATSFTARVQQLRYHVQTSDYDVLVGLMPHWNLLVLLATRGLRKPPATLVSGRNVEAPLRRVHGRSYRVELALARRLYPRADGYVAISHPVAAEATATYGLDPDRVWVVPNPATGKQPTAGVRRGHGPVGARTVTLTVPARLVPQKRPELAVHTAAALRERHGVEAMVEYFGRGPEQVGVEAAAAEFGVPVRFRGWVDAWFDEAAPDAVVLLPSLAEGFGNVLVEAAAVGIPSVTCSRALGVADAVVPNVTGVLTMGADPDELAEAVVSAMDLTPVHAPGWLERFSPAASGRALLQVLRAVTSLRSSRRTSTSRRSAVVAPWPLPEVTDDSVDHHR